MASNIVHFEIYVDDIERAKSFYRAVLGWEFSYIESMNYTLVYPGGEVHDGPASVGINGGLQLRPGPPRADDTAAPNAFVCTASVDDIDDTLARVESSGGRIDMPASAIPGVGRLAYVRDTESNMIGLLQPDMPGPQ